MSMIVVICVFIYLFFEALRLDFAKITEGSERCVNEIRQFSSILLSAQCLEVFSNVEGAQC